MAAWSAFAAAVLLLIGLVVLLVTGSARKRILLQQAQELARLRHEMTELREPPPVPSSDANSLHRIGAATRVFQIGDHVQVIDGPNRGDYGIVAPGPDWLKQGYVCVELANSQTRIYMAVSRLSPIDG